LLESLDTDRPFVINTANLITAVRFAFNAEHVAIYVSVSHHGRDTEGIGFPCAHRGILRLLDGGVYDNTGLEAIDGDR
jgi:hypothetical protein